MIILDVRTVRLDSNVYLDLRFHATRHTAASTSIRYFGTNRGVHSSVNLFTRVDSTVPLGIVVSCTSDGSGSGNDNDNGNGIIGVSSWSKWPPRPLSWDFVLKNISVDGRKTLEKIQFASCFQWIKTIFIKSFNWQTRPNFFHLSRPNCLVARYFGEQFYFCFAYKFFSPSILFRFLGQKIFRFLGQKLFLRFVGQKISKNLRFVGQKIWTHHLLIKNGNDVN